MMNHIATLTAIAVVLTTGFARGEEPGPNYEHLKPMEWIIGTWVAEITAPEDAPEDASFAAKKGDLVRVVFEGEWALNKNVIQSHFTLSVNDEVAVTADGTIGWAADKKQIIEFGFDSSGGRGESVYSIVNDNSFRIRSREISPDGVVTESTSTVTLTDNDTVTSERTEITVGGDKKPDEPPLELKRVKK